MKLEKLKMREVKSDFERLRKESIALIFGGYGYGHSGTAGISCGHTGSSCGCDNAAVCNCPRPLRYK